MLICVCYDKYNGASVAHMNEIKNDPRFCSGSFSFSGSLDYLASTSGFVCFRCREEYQVDPGGGGDSCWIFETSNGVSEFTDIMAVLHDAKFHSLLIANTTRGLIETARVMCTSCRRLNRPLDAHNVVYGTSQFSDQVEMKPYSSINTPVHHRQEQAVSITEISSDLENSPNRVPDHVAAHQEVSMTVEEFEQIDSKPNIAAPELGVTMTSPIEGTSVTPGSNWVDQRDNGPVTVKQERTEVDDQMAAETTGNALIRHIDQFTMRVVKQETCEATLAAATANNVEQTATHWHHTSNSAGIINEAVQRLRAASPAEQLVEEEVDEEDWWTNVINASDSVRNSAAELNRNRHEINHVPQPNHGQDEEMSGDLPGTSNMFTRSEDSKHGLMPGLQMYLQQQLSHFDYLTATDMSTAFSPANPPVLRKFSAPSISTNQSAIGHSHLSSPEDISVDAVEGYLPIWKVNRNNTRFQAIRLANIKPSTSLRFHSSLLKRKTEEWVKVKISDSQIPSSTYLNFQYELYKRPGQWSKMQRLRLCCDTVLHFILIDTDDLRYRT